MSTKNVPSMLYVESIDDSGNDFCTDF